MNTKLLISASAIFLGLLGVLFSFLPQEILSYFGSDSSEMIVLFLQLLGASSSGISILLGSKFLRPVVFANIIAWPLAYFSLNKWLQSFVYKTDITVWSFAVAALLVLAITILTISLQSRKIARQTPSVSLRYE